MFVLYGIKLNKQKEMVCLFEEKNTAEEYVKASRLDQPQNGQYYYSPYSLLKLFYDTEIQELNLIINPQIPPTLRK